MTVVDVLTEDRSEVERVLEQDARQFYQDFPAVLGDASDTALPFGTTVNGDHTTHEPVAHLREGLGSKPEVVIVPKNLRIMAGVGHMVVFAFEETPKAKISYTKRHVRKIGQGPEEELGEMNITPEDYAVLSLIFNATSTRRAEIGTRAISASQPSAN